LQEGPTATQAKSKQAILAAERDVETFKKWATGQNKQHSITKNMAKLDEVTEELHHDQIPWRWARVPAGPAEQGADSEGLAAENQ